LAAKKLDELWNGWMNRLGEGYLKTLDCLDKGNLKQAELEYRKGYLANVKKLYAEAGSTYPLRFSKAEHWCVWTKKLYVLSRQTEDCLKKQEAEQALELLEQMRRHFYQLHEETATFHCNDVIYEFYTEAAQSKPSEEQLQKIISRLAEAEPSCIAKEKAELYAEAKSAWQTAVNPLLNDGEIDSNERDSLLKASEVFYRAFGIQYE
jgi:uncharacterized protein (UPF0335 family)